MPDRDVGDLPGKDDTQIVMALVRGLDVLGVFRRSDDAGLGNAELAERTGITKPTVSRLTYTLARQGYLDFDPRARVYRLGVKVAMLGAVAQATMSLRPRALPLMRELALASHFIVGLGTRDGLEMVYLDVCDSDALVTLRLVPGRRVGMATSAMGRAYLASLPPGERTARMAELRGLHGDDWPDIVRGIEQGCHDLSRHGFCLSLGDWRKDIHTVAAPIRAAPGQPPYIVNLGGPAYALSEIDIRERHGPCLVGLARSLELTPAAD